MGGGDKSLLTIGGKTIIQRIIDALESRGTNPPPIAISANGDPARFQAFGLPILDDGPFADHGPLAGVLAGLDWAAGQDAESLLTVPGDTPFVPPGLAATLAPAPSCARSGGRLHHLVALWPVGCQAELRTFLQNPGSRQVSRFSAWISTRPVDFAIDVCDPFLNVNTPDELDRARDLAERVGTGEDR
jgi:molybdopterin-guanine dinucleotide biosynthesis protein A